MAFPDFFAEVPTLTLHDGLAQLLGASDDGVIEYHYADAVRLAGHSCPTVAGGWLSAPRCTTCTATNCPNAAASACT